MPLIISEGAVANAARKYVLTNETIEVDGQVLYRIKAVRAFAGITPGTLGGFIATESNLYHSGNAWISGHAQVSDNARVSGNVWVSDNARVSGHALIGGKVAQATE